jgi:hypothetical protein
MSRRGDNKNDDTIVVDKEFNTEINFDQDTNIEIKFDKEVDVDVDIKVETDIEGNTAILIFDAQAVGEDTFVEVDTTVIVVEDTVSHVSGNIIAVAG